MSEAGRSDHEEHAERQMSRRELRATPGFEAERDDAARYAAYLESPEGRFRCARFWSLLAPHLPTRGRALDAGGGPGELSARLAQRGLTPTLLDASQAMLDLAETRGIDGLRTVQGDFARAPQLGRFEVVACHLALEYAPDPRAGLHALRGALAAGGVLSLVVRARAGEALKRAAAGDFPRAREALASGRFVEDLSGAEGRLFSLNELTSSIEELGLETLSLAGVRTLPCTIDRSDPDLDAIAGADPDAMRAARYFHVAARAPVARPSQELA